MKSTAVGTEVADISGFTGMSKYAAVVLCFSTVWRVVCVFVIWSLEFGISVRGIVWDEGHGTWDGGRGAWSAKGFEIWRL